MLPSPRWSVRNLQLRSSSSSRGLELPQHRFYHFPSFPRPRQPAPCAYNRRHLSRYRPLLRFGSISQKVDMLSLLETVLLGFVARRITLDEKLKVVLGTDESPPLAKSIYTLISEDRKDVFKIALFWRRFQRTLRIMLLNEQTEMGKYKTVLSKTAQVLSDRDNLYVQAMPAIFVV